MFPKQEQTANNKPTPRVDLWFPWTAYSTAISKCSLPSAKCPGRLWIGNLAPMHKRTAQPRALSQLLPRPCLLPMTACRDPFGPFCPAPNVNARRDDGAGCNEIVGIQTFFAHKHLAHLVATHLLGRPLLASTLAHTARVRSPRKARSWRRALEKQRG